MTPTYASIAIVEFLGVEGVAVEVISVTPESCELSGAWLVDTNDLTKLDQITEGRLVIFIGDKSKSEDYFKSHSRSELNLQEFLDEARTDAASAIKAFKVFVSQNEREYSEYMSIKLQERKHLPKVIKKNFIQPEFYKWPEILDIGLAEEFLESIGKMGKIPGSDKDMINVLSAARLVKHLVDMWRKDEIERRNRLYVLESAAIVSILPTCWLKKV